MTRRTLSCQALIALLLSLLLAGCSGSGDSAAKMQNTETPPPDLPGCREPVIEESDIYRLEGGTLYLQNARTGLNILEVSDPARPRLVGQAAVTGGSAGEMYIRDDLAIVLLKSATTGCRNPARLRTTSWTLSSEVALVDVRSKAQPQLLERYCLPGSLVASRLVNDILYLVTTQDATGSQAIAIDLRDPRQAEVVDQMDFPGASKEILVTPGAIFVASRAKTYDERTRVQVISIADSGQMTERGAFEVKGSPQGRFHMDLARSEFRIVTYETSRRASRLSVLDVSDPDDLRLIGDLADIGYGERLYATRFDGFRAYMVTFRQTDPLWIIDLKDPAKPTIVGELHVPGWSDFIFPRGDRLVAVGRGPNGNHLGLSYFDVSDPEHPIALDQISLGDPGSTSEANVDFRAVTIIDVPDEFPLVVVPHTEVVYSGGCALKDRISLVDVAGDRLQQRGVVLQRGTVRRTVLHARQLYAISDTEVLAVDIADRDAPQVLAAVTVAPDPVETDRHREYCGDYDDWESQQQLYGGRDFYDGHEYNKFLCSVDAGRGVGLPPLTLLLGLLWLLGRRRRQH